MKKLIQHVSLTVMALLPVSALAYTAPSVSIINPKTTTISDTLNTIIGWILLLVGGISVLFLILGGLKYVTSNGNKDQAESAKQTITYAVIGLIVVVLAEVIVNVVFGTATSLFGK